MRLLSEVLAEARWTEDAGVLSGFLLARRGALAWHLGPCLATAAVGPLLLANAFHRHAGQRVFIDIPDANWPAVQQAEAAGLKAQRPLYRMCRGPAPSEDPARIWATFGPEKG